MNKSKIEWCDMTWNPVTGCLHGCEYCYAQEREKPLMGEGKEGAEGTGLKMCGFYGCHVGNKGECDCTHCDSCSALCNSCNRYPNRARRDLWLSEAMSAKCKMCRDAIRSRPEKGVENETHS